MRSTPVPLDTLRRTDGATAVAGRHRWSGVLQEAALVIALWLAYNAGRFLAARHTGRAFAHAAAVWHLERTAHLPDEAHLQHSVLIHHLGVIRLSDDYYRWVHLPVTLVVLVWLFRYRPASYLWVRTAMIYTTAAALAIHVAYPVAPPRMLPRLGFVDTGLRYGQSAYGPRGSDRIANELAAMPSLHVGWALLLAVAVIATCRSRWRWWALAHPLLTVFVVVVTANHFWVDGLAGAALAAAGLALANGQRTTTRRQVIDESQRAGGCSAPRPASRSR